MLIKYQYHKEEPYGIINSFKYFIGYNDNDIIRPLCVKLPEMIDYGKKFEFNLTMSFKIRDKELSKKVQSNMKKN